MADPLTTLFVAVISLAALGFILWPEVGVVARWQRAKRNTRRIQIEDALKHLYDCESRRLTSTRQSIAGALSISEDKAANLLVRLEGMGLLRSHGEGFVLTDDGRSYALRIIRVHRLWERYLADETGVQETAWHPEAERQEHRMTPDEANSLAEYMGNPQFDPHGDPIPSAVGEIPAPKGQSLVQLPEGSVGQIVHIEDEPRTMYAQLVAEGLYPGMQVQMFKSSAERVRFAANGEERVLAPLFARNVTVVSLPAEEKSEGFLTLATLRLGKRAVVLGISGTCRGHQRRRLMDLGVVPGTLIKAEMKSASGDPTAYQIRGAMVALRKKQAEQIYVEPAEEAA